MTLSIAIWGRRYYRSLLLFPHRPFYSAYSQPVDPDIRGASISLTRVKDGGVSA